MPWTWFISLEVQFFIIGCLIMLLVKVHVCYALVIGISIFVIALIAATLWLLVPYQEYGYRYIFGCSVSRFFLFLTHYFWLGIFRFLL